MIGPAQVSITVGVLVERRKARSPWAGFLYRPVGVLPGVPDAAPWTVIDSGEDVATFYAGQGVIELHRTETLGYRDNLTSGAPALWVSLRPIPGEERYDVLLVTADPAEGEALVAVGSDLVESVPMPAPIHSIVTSFVTEHPIERPFFKRQRDRSTAHAAESPGNEQEDEG